jgi:hypothetical protein
MGTLQTELANLKFDDDPEPTTATVVAPAAPAVEPVIKSRVLWAWLRDNPMSSGRQAAEATGLEVHTAQRMFNQFFAKGHLSRQMINNSWHYTALTTTYPAEERGASLERAWAARSEMAKAGTLKHRKSKKKSKPVVGEKRKPGRPPKQKPVVVTPPPPPPVAPVQEQVQMVPAYNPSEVDTWPVSMAKAFYIKLKKYFGDA